VSGDSQLVIHQVTGVWDVREPTLEEYCDEVQELVARVAGGVRFRWIRREQNRYADALASGRDPADPSVGGPE